MEGPIAVLDNAAANLSGFNMTEHMEGMIPYSTRRTKYLQLVCDQILIFDGFYDEKTKIRALGKQLLELELKNQKLRRK